MECLDKHPTMGVKCWLPVNHFQDHRCLVENEKAGQPNQAKHVTHSWSSGRL